MRGHLPYGIAVVIASVVPMWGCQLESPSSPSALTPGTPGAARQLRPNDEPADDDPYPPDPGVPPGTPMPPSSPARIINIIGTAGANAFVPNPLAIEPGEMIVWTNDDLWVHHIVLDDGTDVGTVAPGQSSVPIALANPAATYHCTLHPSMVGNIGGEPPVPPLPPPYDPDPDPYPEPDPYPYALPRGVRR
jgi:plastocyanin